MFHSRFEGQSAIVTGGASGIGRAVAHRLAREGAGVAILDVSKDAIEQAVSQFRADGLNVSGAVVDVADEPQVAKVFDEQSSRPGRLDVVVHCAGIVGPNGKKITQIEAKDFDQVIRVNLRGAFLITKHALLHMEKHNYGRILLFASIAGKEGNAGMSCYSTSKAGVIGLAKAVGKEFATTGITINAIAPAVIRTAMVDAMEPAQVKYMTDKIPMQRCGTLDEIAAISCWIVSKEATYNTGFTFDLTGGRAVH